MEGGREGGKEGGRERERGREGGREGIRVGGRERGREGGEQGGYTLPLSGCQNVAIVHRQHQPREQSPLTPSIHLLPPFPPSKSGRPSHSVCRVPTIREWRIAVRVA